MSGQRKRIAECFHRLQAEGKTALITFVTAGDPDLDTSEQLMYELVEAGADILELGVPFSDPMADGPVIQQANERALAHNVSLANVMELVARFRTQDQQTPVVLMGYLNPIERMGYEEFASAAQNAGVDGVLTVDMPVEESGNYRATLSKVGLDTVFLVAPTSGPDRSQMIADASSGFLYYVSVKGVTGGIKADFSQVRETVEGLKALGGAPVGVGFGISSPEDAAIVAAFSDAVVVGSAIIKQLESAPGQAGIRAAADLVGQLRTAMDAAVGV
ncbi:MAG: tryptophan synthase subunit alpha [Immundisolibacteraceae bacterium]|nr:tryptophan synthase subunit alpha [Immundisolibacteraceae bacterium]